MKYPSILNLRKRTEDGKELIANSFASPAFEFFMDSHDWILTEKVDGMNIRITFDGSCLPIFNGRTDRAQLHKELVAHLKDTFYNMDFPEGTILFGEGYGAGIQRGGKYSDTKQFMLFDIWSGSYWYEHDHVKQIAEVMNIPVVPEYPLFTRRLDNIEWKVANGIKSNFGDFDAEGIVVRPKVNLFDSWGKRIMMKIKTKDYFRKPEQDWWGKE